MSELSENEEAYLIGMPQPGTVFAGNYQIESVLGQGGTGVVYKAKHQSLGRELALKVLRKKEGKRGEQARGRFYVEAQSVGLLQHDNIVAGFAAGTSDDGYFFIASELLHGRTLDDLLHEKQALNLEEFADLLFSVLAGLEFAHSKGVVHRDIKPGNIFLTESGETKIVDFGIAYRLEDPGLEPPRKKITGPGAYVGTAAYMSPEQARGKSVDQRSDIYSCGVLIYRCLCGKLPFEADTALKQMVAHLQEQAPDLAGLASGIESDKLKGLNLIVKKCLEKEPDKRYQSVSELKTELAKCLDFELLEERGFRKFKTATIVILFLFVLSSVFLIGVSFTGEQKQEGKINSGASRSTSSEDRPMQTQVGDKFLKDPRELVLLARNRRHAADHGEVLEFGDRISESLQLYDKALEALSKTASRPYLSYMACLGKAKSLDRLASVTSEEAALPETQRKSKAAKMRAQIEDLLLLALKQVKPGSYETGCAYRLLGQNCLNQGEYEEARSWLKKSVALKESVSDPDPGAAFEKIDKSESEDDNSLALGEVYLMLVQVAEKQKKLSEQLKYLNRACDFFMERRGGASSETYPVLVRSFEYLALSKQKKEAMNLMDRLVKLCDKEEEDEEKIKQLQEIADAAKRCDMDESASSIARRAAGFANSGSLSAGFKNKFDKWKDQFD